MKQEQFFKYSISLGLTLLTQLAVVISGEAQSTTLTSEERAREASYPRDRSYDPNDIRTHGNNVVLRRGEMAMTEDHEAGSSFLLRCSMPGRGERIPGYRNLRTINLRLNRSTVYHTRRVPDPRSGVLVAQQWLFTCGNPQAQPQAAAPAPVAARQRSVPATTAPRARVAPEEACISPQLVTRLRLAPVMMSYFDTTRACESYDAIGYLINNCLRYEGETVEQARQRWGFSPDRHFTAERNRSVMIDNRLCVSDQLVGRYIGSCSLFAGETYDEARARFGLDASRNWPRQMAVEEVRLEVCANGRERVLSSQRLEPDQARDFERIRELNRIQEMHPDSGPVSAPGR